MKPVIVNVAVNHWYPTGQQRLIDSLHAQGYAGAQLMYRDTLPPGSPTHQVVPYHFKTYALLEAKRLGYTVALWLDASIWAIKPVVPLMEEIERQGYMMWNCGFSVGQWCSDRALQILDVDREEALTLPLVVGGILGINFQHPSGYLLLERLHDYAKRGAFQGPWKNDSNQASMDPRVYGHRHDQPVLGVLRHRLNLQLTDCPYGFAYDVDNTTPNPNTVFLARGM